MAGPFTPGNVELLTTKFNEQVHNIALAKVIMKQAVFVQSSTAGVERFYKESIVDPDVSAQIPRDAEFISDQVVLDTLDIRPQKHGAESRIAWEDSITPGPNLIERTSIRLGNRVARSVNTRIWNIMSDSQSAVDINTLATSAAWDNSTRANRIPHEDIAEAISKCTEGVLQAYSPTEIYLSPKDYVFVRTNDYIMSSFDSSSPQLMENGMMGKLLGLNVIVNPVVTADFSVVADSKKAVTWAEVAGLTTSVTYTPGKHYLFTAFEYGNAALLNPKAVCLITNTQA